jgi:hypothetical protein
MKLVVDTDSTKNGTIGEKEFSIAKFFDSPRPPLYECREGVTGLDGASVETGECRGFKKYIHKTEIHRYTALPPLYKVERG